MEASLKSNLNVWMNCHKVLCFYGCHLSVSLNVQRVSVIQIRKPRIAFGIHLIFLHRPNSCANF